MARPEWCVSTLFPVFEPKCLWIDLPRRAVLGTTQRNSNRTRSVECAVRREGKRQVGARTGQEAGTGTTRKARKARKTTTPPAADRDPSAEADGARPAEPENNQCQRPNGRRHQWSLENRTVPPSGSNCTLRGIRSPLRRVSSGNNRPRSTFHRKLIIS